ncbi:hypothetical protein D6764_05000 [Candidatus Woesearchaeota archaeon]|nr:MAG: hypothetical protein D6764_05000 [Candidatus Woesearchaeota archaeon]
MHLKNTLMPAGHLSGICRTTARHLPDKMRNAEHTDWMKSRFIKGNTGGNTARFINRLGFPTPGLEVLKGLHRLQIKYFSLL